MTDSPKTLSDFDTLEILADCEREHAKPIGERFSWKEEPNWYSVAAQEVHLQYSGRISLVAYRHVALALAERVKILEPGRAEAMALLDEVHEHIEGGFIDGGVLSQGLADRIRIAVEKDGADGTAR